MLPSVLILSVLALAALGMARARPFLESQATRDAAARALIVATAVQGLHFLEEATTGFATRFPAFWGRSEMPFLPFVVFNLGWLAAWGASVPGIRAGRPAAQFAAWFLAIAGVFNGVGHPLLALGTGGYFPGVLTAPLSGVASAVLWIQLRRATAPR